MLQQERFFKIIEYLKEHRTVEFVVLAELTNVSIGTVRRDLMQLEESGMVKVVRGGASYRGDNLAKQPFDTRIVERAAEKNQLATVVGDVVEEGQSLALNSGTTNLAVATYLAENYRRLTIVTNNLHIVHVLEKCKNFTLILTGGIFDPSENALYGKQCEKDFCAYNIDIAFIAANSLSLEKGVTDFRLNQIPIMKAIVAHARRKIVVADSSKLQRVACANVCELTDLDGVITDEGGKDAAQKYAQVGLKVMLPKGRWNQ